jgi:hypothetical protein
MAGAATAVLASMIVPDAAFAAYSPTDAATYADKYYANHNGAYITFSDDCTNFVSQAMYYAGHPFKGTPNAGVINDSSQWWKYGNASGRTYSWSVADSLGSFLSVYDTRADGGHHQTAGTILSQPPSPVGKGDPVFYIWNVATTSKYQHASIIVTSGTDPTSGWTGYLVDQHSTDRRHAIWHLKPYNSQWASTSYTEFHLS